MKIKRILAFTFLLTGIFGLYASTTDYDLAKSKSALFAPPCKMRVTNSTNNFHGVSLNNRNIYAFANSTVTMACPCSGFIQLYTPGPIYWELINNTPNTFSYGRVVWASTMGGLFDIDNFNYTPTPCTPTECF